ncbi:MAG: FUN14 domain-containing protein [Nitrospiraceae bacterium]
MGLLDSFNSTAMAEAHAIAPDPPWKAKTVVAAGLATVAGLAGWMTDLASPAIARFGGSYIAGFFIGWALRRFVKLMVVLGALAIAAIALLKNAGWWTTDWAALERQVTDNAAALRLEQRG